MAIDEQARMQRHDMELKIKQLEAENKRDELRIELARLGLRGTLIGVICAFTLIAILVAISAFSEKVNITGTHLCIMIFMLSAAVISFGAFVFNRTAKITGQAGTNKIDVLAGDAKPDDGADASAAK